MNIEHDYATVVIYHGGCPDGLCAAWAFRQADLYARDFGVVRYHGTHERCFEKDMHMPNLDNRHVYIVDYSYSVNTLESIRQRAASLVVLDHHKTARETFGENLPDWVHFDMNMCGAEMTWDYLYGFETRPWFMQHIRDRDLWLWKHPKSRSFSAVLYKEGLKFATLDKLFNEKPEHVYAVGDLLLNSTNDMVNHIAQAATRATFAGHVCYAVETVVCVSEVGNKLCELLDCDLAFIYRYNIVTKKWHISLRGNNKVDVANLAKQHGGGGHANAAGFTYTGNISDIISA